jgi:hypothetical protein
VQTRQLDGGRLLFSLNTTGLRDQLLFSNAVLSKDRWYHIAALRSGTLQALYIDSALDTYRTCPSDPIAYDGGTYNDDNVSIGRWTSYENPAYFFQGLIDDVRIYHTALSPAEIQEIYKAGLDGLVYADPLFADANGGDFHLKSERGRYWPQHNVWVLDDATSPAIDAGMPAADPANERLPNGGRVNIGAYGNTACASMSELAIRGDTNADGIFDFQDFAALAVQWLETEEWY